MLLEGARVIDEALDAAADLEFLLFSEGEGTKWAPLRDRAAARSVPCLETDPALLAEGSDLDAPTGVVAVATRPQSDAAQVFADCAQAGELILVAAGVQDPGNVGALIRVGAGLGAGAIALLQGSASAWHPRSIRGASGTGFRLPVVESLAPSGFLALCHENGLPVWTTAADGDDFRSVPASACALVLGEEGRGVPEELDQVAAKRVGIPLTRSVESLNVATAAAVLVAALAPGGSRA